MEEKSAFRFKATALMVPPVSPRVDDTELQGFALDEATATKARIVQEALDVPPGRKKSEWIQDVVTKWGVSRPTVYRYLAKHREGKIQALKHRKRNKGKPNAWSPEALKHWLGLVLKREHRKISKKALYKILLSEAGERGWRVGSYQNACKQIADHITPQLWALQKGGRLALDNSLPPILRDYSDLEPFEILVGDQHRFDFWCQDSTTGEVFRPEAYLWQDLRTRLIFGGAVDKKYNSHLMALALRIGVYYFGLFRNIYTDNGKPELSKYIGSILEDVKAYHLSVHETVDFSTNLDDLDPELIRPDIQVGEHRKAIVRNGKGKMIERSNLALEDLCRDYLRLPGYAKRLTDGEEEQRVDQKELKRLADSGKLPTFEEFMAAFYKALTFYNTEKPHRGVLHEWQWQPKPKSATPEDCRQMCMRDGWRPTKITRDAIDLLFLPKETSPRTIDRGGVRFRNSRYVHKALNPLHGNKVYLRFNPLDLKFILVFQNGKFLCRAEAVEYSSMRDRELASRKIQEKAELRKEALQQFASFTDGIADIRQFSTVPGYEKTAAVVGNDKRKKATENKDLYDERTPEQLALEVKQLETVQEEDKGSEIPIPEDAPKRPFFFSEQERYDWILGCQVKGFFVCREDREWQARFESQMDPETLEYWEERKRFGEVSCSTF